MKGYKGFDKNLKCRGFQYEVGKTYECGGAVELCENGFHFCKEPKQIKDYYGDLAADRYCEVEAGGEVVEGDGKCVCSKITIVREIPSQDFMALVNNGNANIGWANEGDWNKGNRNEGDSNKGNLNEGNWNKGDWNKGDSNEGDSNEGNSNEGDSNKGNSNEGDSNKGNLNEGDWNKGNWNKGNLNEGNSNEGDSNEGNSNKGDWNKGNWNIGDFNHGDDLCGLFNTDGGCVIFNKYTKIKWTNIANTRGYSYLSQCINEGREPSECELKEIEKLPNFNEKVMNELIFGKKEASK